MMMLHPKAQVTALPAGVLLVHHLLSHDGAEQDHQASLTTKPDSLCYTVVMHDPRQSAL